MENKNILICSDMFLSREGGGASRVVYESARVFGERGRRVDVISTGRGEEIGHPDIKNLHIHKYPANYEKKLYYFVSIMKNTKKIFEKLLEKQNYDVINFHSPLPALSVLMSGKSKNIYKVYSFHSPWHKEYEIRLKYGSAVSAFLKKPLVWLRKYAERIAISKCHCVVVLSCYMKEELQKTHVVPDKKIVIIPGGVDTEKFNQADNKAGIRARLGLPEERLILFTVRNLMPRMGLENLIEAMRDVVPENRNVFLVIGGEGYLRPELEKMVNNSHLEDYVRFTGFIQEDELPLYYQASDLFVLPTRLMEGFGLVTLEALSSGVPVLGTPVGGTEEILNSLDRRLLFEDSSPASMARSIIDFAGEPEKLNELKKSSRRFVLENYSWQKFASEMEEVLFSGRKV